MDTPYIIYRWLIGAPSTSAMKIGTLKFCGIDPVRTDHFGPIKHSTIQQREAWLQTAFERGLALQHGTLRTHERWFRLLKPWIKAVRLQFYPMTFIAYLLGSVLAIPTLRAFDLLQFLLGYLFLFLLEVVTVFLNELYDLPSDQRNKWFGPSMVAAESSSTKNCNHSNFGPLSLL